MSPYSLYIAKCYLLGWLRDSRVNSVATMWVTAQNNSLLASPRDFTKPNNPTNPAQTHTQEQLTGDTIDWLHCYIVCLLQWLSLLFSTVCEQPFGRQTATHSQLLKAKEGSQLISALAISMEAIHICNWINVGADCLDVTKHLPCCPSLFIVGIGERVKVLQDWHIQSSQRRDIVHKVSNIPLYP